MYYLHQFYVSLLYWIIVNIQTQLLTKSKNIPMAGQLNIETLYHVYDVFNKAFELELELDLSHAVYLYIYSDKWHGVTVLPPCGRTQN